MADAAVYFKGEAPVKALYIKKSDSLPPYKRINDASSSSDVADAKRAKPDEESSDLPDSKRTKIDESLNDDDLEAAGKSEHQTSDNRTKKRFDKKDKRGMNKKREVQHLSDASNLCPHWEDCPRVKDGRPCKNGHDLAEYLKTKPADAPGTCYLYETFGFCQYGFRCRWAGSHVDVATEKNLVNEPLDASIQAAGPRTLNVTSKATMVAVRKRQTPTPKSKEYIDIILPQYQNQRQEPVAASNGTSSSAAVVDKREDTILEDEPVDAKEMPDLAGPTTSPQNEDVKVDQDMNDVELPLRPEERKQLDWKNKLYLAPLTTVGNLPFRRIAKKMGADITCGEMALAQQLVSGHAPEWALLKRHVSEDFFGVQIAASSVQSATGVAEIVSRDLNVDFIDLNCGCPIDLVTRQGAGSQLLERSSKLSDIVRGMVFASTVPITIKLRTGWSAKNSVAHKLATRFKLWGVSAATLHGRSREQRYTKLADWDYIHKTARDAMQTAPDFPVFGNGDIMSFEDYHQHYELEAVEGRGLAGVMIARGALIKPWIFTEIKERRTWDISARERLDIFSDFAKYALEHWGSDTMGVSMARRYLCEWQSFTHRYVPSGLLEVLPQRLNDRVPPIWGRDETETLLASPNSEDWVKVTELFLGKPAADFKFIPKHKANSVEQDQG
ncbi:hypothetical protein SmJEL517_g02453 [Synchytrium microbalum]|uniref:tRNA-dihydrouridine(47) synthase [NAD(P)(+)] n=1 Tax=Synchytrium microbalum TaxID=1806994 RepID=A0A507C6I1_9FUNG|nr:uncharacterized protein SmJEL517_g02453 [Synchytrium microbalum]TPX35111.1 hypothetical protein SmJEL517_g02453 [Synchytrium microbalum]